VKRRGHVTDSGLDERIIFKWIIDEKIVMIWTEFIRIRVGTRCELV
jgi:hypothetical protein